MVRSENTALKPPGKITKTSGGAAPVKAKLSKKKQIPQHAHNHEKQPKEFVNARNRQHKKGNKFAVGKTKKAKSAEKGPFVVVITNVENDFAKVHQDFLPRYCCLNEAHRHSADTANTNTESRQCRYTVSARTETRSVEISVYGKADADVSTVFQSVRPAPVSDKGNSKGAQKKKTESAAVESAHTRGCSTTSDDTHAKGFATLEDMAVALRRKPYFTHPPQFYLNVPERKDGDAPRQAKRQRGELDSQREKSQVLTTNDEEEGHDEDNEEVKKTEDTNEKALNGVHHLATQQADMVTAVASTSSRLTTKEIRYQMRDIPGFVNCWLLYPQHFRVVFATKRALFKAKQLLDQFEVDSHVRVSITLSDNLGRDFAEFVAAEELVS